MKKIFTDITAIEDSDINDWIAGFQLAVSDQEFNSMAAIVDDTWKALLEMLEDGDFDIVLADNAPAYLTQYIHGCMVKQRAFELGADLRVGAVSSAFYGQEPNNHLVRKSGSFYSQYRLAAKRLAKNVVFNRHHGFLGRLRGIISPDMIALGSNDPLRERYVHAQKITVDSNYVSLLLGNLGKGKEKLGSTLHSFVLEFLDTISCQILEKFAVPIDRQRLQELLQGRLEFLSEVHCRALEANPKTDILVTESANPVHKTIAGAWRRRGKRAIGFHHGHAIGELRIANREYNEFAAYDQFICPDELSADALARVYASSPISKRRAVSFDAPPNPVSSSYKLRGGFVQQVRRVMIMGYPMNAMRYPFFNGMYWESRLELEIRLVKLLLGAGFEVAYKVHPDRREPVSSIMRKLGVQVLGGKFEEITNHADAVVITYFGSSSVPFILRTNLPVYLIDPHDGLWDKDYKALLARRCEIFESHFTERGIAEFDEERFIGKLRTVQNGPDYSYVEKYYSWL
jgi:hypothetical protein